jgi:hypothetical protein
MARGWNWLINSRKWHYFNHSNVSLCGKYMTITLPSSLDDTNDDSKDNCVACKRAIKALREVEAEEEKAREEEASRTPWVQPRLSTLEEVLNGPQESDAQGQG